MIMNSMWANTIGWKHWKQNIIIIIINLFIYYK